ncbi:hypothetical protein ES707_09213 [subsurface metagenome]
MKKFLLIALVAALVVTGGAYAYTWATGGLTIEIAEPTADVANINTSEGQPAWGSVTDNLSGNTTCGEVPIGDLFTVTPNQAYSGDLIAELSLTNTGSLIKAYRYLNMKVYMYGSAEAEETPNFQVVTLQNGQATFSLEELVSSVDNWTQTSQSDFEGGTLVQLDTTTSPGDVFLDTYTDNVTDNFTDESKIASSENLTVSGGQVKLTVETPGTETLRPNATGNVTNISSQYPDSGAHWDKVDEATSDNWSTYVSTNSTSYQRDLYNIPDHTVGTGGINYVTVHFRFAGDREVYAIPYAGDGDPGYLKTVEIASSGNITDTVIDTLNFDTVRGKTPHIIHISGDVYAIPYTGGPADSDLGQLKTVEILSSGTITDTAIDTLEFDALKGKTPRITLISGDVYAIAYSGDGDDGFLKTVEITSSGTITDTVIDTLEFDTVKGATPDIVYVSGGRVYARAAIRTHDTVYTGSTENTTGDDFMAESYQWTTNPNTASDWTWDEIDNLEIGIDLRTDDSGDNVYCTQVYVEVDYSTYYARGELLSINLLSGEAVASTDNFTYNASAIPSGTGLRAQFSTDNTTWYSSSNVPDGWDTLSQGTHAIDLSGLGWSGPNFYYTIEFTSANQTGTPVLDEIAVTFTSYHASGNLTSSNHDAGYDAFWYNNFFTINEPSGTDIKFQLRTAATEGGLSSAIWYGPSGTGDYYTTSGAAINEVHDGDRWIQYKAYFAGPSDRTPKLSDIMITYATSAEFYAIEIIGGGYCLVSDNTSEWGEGWATTPEFYCEVTQR